MRQVTTVTDLPSTKMVQYIKMKVRLILVTAAYSILALLYLQDFKLVVVLNENDLASEGSFRLDAICCKKAIELRVDVKKSLFSFYIKTTPTLMGFTAVTNAHGTSPSQQQHAGLQHSV